VGEEGNPFRKGLGHHTVPVRAGQLDCSYRMVAVGIVSACIAVAAAVAVPAVVAEVGSSPEDLALAVVVVEAVGPRAAFAYPVHGIAHFLAVEGEELVCSARPSFLH